MAALGTCLASIFQRLPTNFCWVGGCSCFACYPVTCIVCTNKTLVWNACVLAFADNQYRTGGHDDYFGLEDYRKIVYASKPDPKEEEFDLDPHNNITHLSAHQLAFVEIKASSAT